MMASSPMTSVTTIISPHTSPPNRNKDDSFPIDGAPFPLSLSPAFTSPALSPPASPPRMCSLKPPAPPPPAIVKIGYSISRASTTDSAGGSDLGHSVASTHSDEKHIDHHLGVHQRVLPSLCDCSKGMFSGGATSDDEDEQDEGRSGLADQALEELLTDILGVLGVVYNREDAVRGTSVGDETQGRESNEGGSMVCRNFKETTSDGEQQPMVPPTPETTGTSQASTPQGSLSPTSCSSSTAGPSPSPSTSTSACISPRNSLPLVSCVNLRRAILDAISKNNTSCADVNLAQLLQQLVKYVSIDQTDLDQPSLGALLHAHGICKPCVFANKNSKVCHNGSSCYFCHHYHKERRRRSKKTKKDIDIPPPPPLSSPASNSGRARIPPPPCVPPPPPPPYSSGPLRPSYRNVAASAGGAVRTPSTLNRSAMPFHPSSAVTNTTNGPAEMASMLLSDLSSDVLMKLHEAIQHAVVAKQIQEDNIQASVIPNMAESNQNPAFRYHAPPPPHSSPATFPPAASPNHTPHASPPFHLNAFNPLPLNSIPPPPPGLSLLPRHQIPPPPAMNPRSPCFSLSQQYRNTFPHQQTNNNDFFPPASSPTTSIGASSRYFSPPPPPTHGTTTPLSSAPPTPFHCSSALMPFLPEAVAEALYSPHSKFGQQQTTAQQLFLQQAAAAKMAPQTPTGRRFMLQPHPAASSSRLLPPPPPLSAAMINGEPYGTPTAGGSDSALAALLLSPSFINFLSSTSPSSQNTNKHNASFGPTATTTTGAVTMTGGGGGPSPPMLSNDSVFTYQPTPTTTSNGQHEYNVNSSRTYSTTQPSTPRYSTDATTAPLDTLQQLPALSPELCSLLALAAANSAGVSAEELQDILMTLPEGGESAGGSSGKTGVMSHPQ
eukprot:GHVS01030701.1.p1 GENE.GHVS01030701.1~~GHVS01030701.1.p1  ORF type:complete len:889 (-),score=219.73 GHVS01030701.1:768-3434(-)